MGATPRTRLVQTFGARNVSYRWIDWEEGTRIKASVVYPNDPRRRFKVVWYDGKHRRLPERIVLESYEVSPKSDWTLANHLRLGMSLAEVERLNGRPFTLSGFGWDFGGGVWDWRGGRLNDMMQECQVRLYFDPLNRDQRFWPSGDNPFLSSDPAMRKVAPVTYIIFLDFERKP